MRFIKKAVFFFVFSLLSGISGLSYADFSDPVQFYVVDSDDFNTTVEISEFTMASGSEATMLEAIYNGQAHYYDISSFNWFSVDTNDLGYETVTFRLIDSSYSVVDSGADLEFSGLYDTDPIYNFDLYSGLRIDWGDGNTIAFSTQKDGGLAAVPIPSVALLMGSAFSGLAIFRRQVFKN